MIGGLTKDLVRTLVRDNSLKDGVLPYVFALNQIPLYGAVCPIARIHEFVTHRAEVGVALVIMISNNPLVALKFFFLWQNIHKIYQPFKGLCPRDCQI